MIKYVFFWSVIFATTDAVIIILLTLLMSTEQETLMNRETFTIVTNVLGYVLTAILLNLFTVIGISFYWRFVWMPYAHYKTSRLAGGRPMPTNQFRRNVVVGVPVVGTEYVSPLPAQTAQPTPHVRI